MPLGDEDLSLYFGIIQYADGTLILLRGVIPTIVSKIHCRRIDSQFSQIHFVPMHISPPEAAMILGCNVDSFPKKYLSLPLSPHKLRVGYYHSP